MTRRDYVKLAKALANGRVNYPHNLRDNEGFADGYVSATREIALAMSRDNASFDMERFMDCSQHWSAHCD